MKCIILENLSATTKIESLSFFDLGKPKTKSIMITSLLLLQFELENSRFESWTLNESFMPMS
jgi:hypothetical protein